MSGIEDIVGVISVLASATLSVIGAVFLLASISDLRFLIGFFLFSAASLSILYLGLMRVSPPPPPQYRMIPQGGPTETKPTPDETEYMIARLELPKGGFLPVTGAYQMFGRENMQGQVSAGEANVISRAHFAIFFRGGKFYVEDKASKNGTLLNRTEIMGTGPHEIKEGDAISPAGTLELRFRT